MFEDKLKKIITLNNRLTQKLNIKHIKENQNFLVIKKIVLENLKKYIINFQKDHNQLDKKGFINYIEKITSYLENKIYLSKNLQEKHILTLHKLIVEPLSLTEKMPKHLIGAWRDHPQKIKWTVENHYFERWFPAPNKIPDLMKNLISEYNTNIKKSIYKIDEILKFILTSIFKVHPFSNSNWKTFYILLDILLRKNNFFPIFPKSMKHEKILLNFLKKYDYNPSFNNLFNCFLEFVIYVYTHYRI